MRIDVNRPSLNNDKVAPVDPLRPPDVNDHFQLALETSATTITPFDAVEVDWVITEQGRVRAQDYVFDLVHTFGVLSQDVDTTGSLSFNPHRNTLLRVHGRRRGQGGPATLGTSVAITIDESSCQTLELPAILIDGLVKTRLTDLTSDTASLRLRKRVVSLNPVTRVEMEVGSTWKPGSITYDFPMEVVINNFFNADLDVDVTIKPIVHHDGNDTDLEVTITHNSDVDFDTFEDIASLGHSATAAKTADKLLPLVIAAAAREAERELVRQVLAYLRPRLETHRLLAVRVVPNGNLSYLSLVLCPRT